MTGPRRDTKGRACPTASVPSSPGPRRAGPTPNPPDNPRSPRSTAQIARLRAGADGMNPRRRRRPFGTNCGQGCSALGAPRARARTRHWVGIRPIFPGRPPGRQGAPRRAPPERSTYLGVPLNRACRAAVLRLRLDIFQVWRGQERRNFRCEVVREHWTGAARGTPWAARVRDHCALTLEKTVNAPEKATEIISRDERGHQRKHSRAGVVVGFSCRPFRFDEVHLGPTARRPGRPGGGPGRLNEIMLLNALHVNRGERGKGARHYFDPIGIFGFKGLRPVDGGRGAVEPPSGGEEKEGKGWPARPMGRGPCPTCGGTTTRSRCGRPSSCGDIGPRRRVVVARYGSEQVVWARLPHPGCCRRWPGCQAPHATRGRNCAPT